MIGYVNAVFGGGLLVGSGVAVALVAAASMPRARLVPAPVGPLPGEPPAGGVDEPIGAPAP